MILPRKQKESGLYGPVWRETNRLIDYVRSITLLSGRGIKISRTMNGTIPVVEVPRQEGGEPGVVRRYLVQQNQNDYWVCANPSGSGTVNVAKPWRLMRSPFHGQTMSFTDEQGRTYTVNYTYLSASRRRVIVNDITTEFQVVVPRMKVGFDYIFASESENGTGVADVDLIDLNADGRAWARER